MKLRGQRQAIVLSTLLLTRGHTVSMARLIDAVWEENDIPQTADKQIRNTISELRQLCPELKKIIETLVTGYRIVVDDSAIDSAQFEARYIRAQRSAIDQRHDISLRELRGALALWHGPALAGINSPTLQFRAVTLNEQRLAAAEQCAELELSSGGAIDSTLADMLVDLLEANPYRERLAGLLMRTFCQTGALGQALAVYDRLHNRMLDDLGIEPGEELRKIHTAIRSRNFPAQIRTPANEQQQPPPCTIPFDGAYFIGRADISSELYSHIINLPDGFPKAVALNGMAGVGKTTLAIHLARQLSHQYPDGQLFIDLKTHSLTDDQVDAGTALFLLLKAIGIPPDRIPHDIAHRTTLWRRELSRRAMVVVLDDAESTAQIGALVSPQSASVTIVTSRHNLSRIDFAQMWTVEPFNMAEGRELFTGIIGDVRPQHDPQSVDKIIEQCGFLPLAIRVASARVRHRPLWTLADFHEHLAKEPRRIIDLSAEDCTLADTFDASYRRLTPNLRYLYGALGCVPEIDVATVARLSRVDVAQAERQLDDLVDAHLLEHSHPHKYHMHKLIRMHAMQLRARDDWRAGTNLPEAM